MENEARVTLRFAYLCAGRFIRNGVKSVLDGYSATYQENKGFLETYFANVEVAGTREEMRKMLLLLGDKGIEDVETILNEIDTQEAAHHDTSCPEEERVPRGALAFATAVAKRHKIEGL